jgi:hypothetical protein
MNGSGSTSNIFPSEILKKQHENKSFHPEPNNGNVFTS